MNYADVFCLFLARGFGESKHEPASFLDKRVSDGTKNEICPWVAPKSDIPRIIVLGKRISFLFSFLGIKSFFSLPN